MERAVLFRFSDYQTDELGHSENTSTTYVYRIEALERFLRKPASDIGPQDLRRFKREARDVYSSQTVAGMLTAVHELHAWANLEHLPWANPEVLWVKPGKVENEDVPPLSVREARLLIDACSTPLQYRLVYLGLYAGTRVSETARMTKAHWKDGKLRFRGSKNRRMREVPVHEDLERARLAINCSPPSHPANLQRTRRELVEKTGVGFRTQQLRKTFATCLLDLGAEWEVVQALLGHSLGVTGVYGRISNLRKQEAISALAF